MSSRFPSAHRGVLIAGGSVRLQPQCLLQPKFASLLLSKARPPAGCSYVMATVSVTALMTQWMAVRVVLARKEW